MQTSAIPARAASTSAARYLSARRLQEILVLQGTPLLGAAFALRQAEAQLIAPLAILMIGNACLVAHIFVLNDWSNMAADLADDNKAADVFTARGVGRREVGALAAALLLGSVLLFGFLGPAPLGLALGIAALSALYSLPYFNWKGRPFLNSAAHLAGGVLHFLLGYSLGHAIDAQGAVLGTYFAVTFAAGHLTQELRDYDGDRRNAIRTNAVVFGRRRTFAASVALFTLSYVLLLLLALQGTFPRALAALAPLCLVHLRWSRQVVAEGYSYASICRLQMRYRALYAVVGAAMLAALWGG